MTFPVKLLSALCLFVSAGMADARVWTNERGVTIGARLVAVRDTEVDLSLQDGRVVTVPKTIFSGSDQEYMQAWVRSGGTLADTDDGVGHSDSPAGGAGYVPIPDNWDVPWPEWSGVAAVPILMTEQETPELSVYTSDHFTIESTKPLQEAERTTLAWRFEAVLKALAALPLNLTVTRRPSRKFLIRVSFDEKEFSAVSGLKLGNIKFSPTRFTVLLRRTTKGVPIRLAEVRPEFAFTHWAMQVTDMEHWLVDGFSSAMTMVPRKGGMYDFRKMPEAVAAEVPKRIRTGKQALPAIADLMARSESHSGAQNDHSRLNEQSRFWGDCLWVVYLCHLQGKGNAEHLKAYLKAYADEQPQEAMQALLAGRTMEQLQADVTKAWATYGLKLRFEAPKLTGEATKPASHGAVELTPDPKEAE